MEEHQYDELLNIFTEDSQDGFYSSYHYHRYEATPYADLEVLFEQHRFKESDCVVDFGCGKGRLPFMIHHRFGSTVTGVEMNEDFCHDARENLQGYLEKCKGGEEKIQFCCEFAEDYAIRREDNVFYFFNPFSVQIFTKVVNNILISLEEASREVQLILYFPSEDYIYYLESQTSFNLVREVGLPALNAANGNERFLIYKLEYC
ncbi:methyltransferase domain-containing protein [Bacillus massilinigeriensis]|uniref:methyltransferase domain-containing protein n=1 Tax=Bacillus mediterraneensis TaxID=1805474 RepID=UPI0008F82D27|nr:methyltransferase domain-containing protein [Bacillus mediterraneensis]